MKVIFENQEYEAEVWHPAMGCLSDTLSYDTETTVVEDPAVVPDYVIGTAFDGNKVYFIQRQNLGQFWKAHQGCVVYMHTASFDLEVTTKACSFDFYPMIEAGLVKDVSIYYRLLRCAGTGDVPHRYSLAALTDELLQARLDKDDAIRMDYGQFYNDGVVNYLAMPKEYLEYAARDAIATYRLAERLDAQCRCEHSQHSPLPQNGTNGTNGKMAQWGLLGHDIQLRGDVALRAIERFGITVDPAAVTDLDRRLGAEIENARAALARFGYVPGKAGNQAEFARIVDEIERARGITIPTTAKTGRKSQAADDLKPIGDHEFVDAFIRAKELEKLRTTYMRHLKAPGGRVHPRYTLLVRTGRTSCSTPNIQNLPRVGGIRECVVPSPGHVFIACDYSMLELCTLAQIAYTRFGQSVMRDLINQGVDLHRHVASMVLGKPASEVTKADRQKAKAIDFGLPGGMGVGGLRDYARASYGVDLTENEAENWRSAWLALFPEMAGYLEAGDDLTRLGATLDLDAYPDPYSGFAAETAAAIVLRVAGGASATSSGRSFSPAEIDWAWAQIVDSRAGEIKALAADIRARKGSRDLQRAVIPGRTISIPTGRIRANCTYTESRNWPFQALAADGAKLALYSLIRAGYRVVAFIHDEVLIEVPETADYRPVAEDISKIMVDAMHRVCPDVEIRTEYAVMRRWTKNAKEIYDEQGRLIPCEDVPALITESTNQLKPPVAA